MNAAQLYDALVAQDIRVTTDGEHLDVEGPDATLTDATIEQIREQKRALIAHLRLFVEADEVMGEIEGVPLTEEEGVAIRTLRRWLHTGAIAALPPDIAKYGYYRDRAECAARRMVPGGRDARRRGRRQRAAVGLRRRGGVAALLRR